MIFRLLEYADNRPLYMDEGLLLTNLVELPVFDFSTTLTKDQLAAPGFLAVERMHGPAAVAHRLGRPADSASVRSRVDVPDAFGRPPLSCRPAPSRSRWDFSPLTIG